MPVRPHQIDTPGGARVLLYTCEVCGAPASFGYGCAGFRDLIREERISLKKLGRWACLEHRAVVEALISRAHPAATQQQEPHDESSTGDRDLLG